MRPIVWLVIFAVYAVAELLVMVWVAALTSWLLVLAVFVVGGVVGAMLMSAAGSGALISMQGSLRTASVPAGDVGSHGLRFLAGLLIAIPGFISDIVGLVLLIPPVAAKVQSHLGVRTQNWMRRRGFSAVKVTRPDGTQGSRIAPGDIVEGEILDPE